MKVYALVGKSGTGKSYRAMSLCRDKNIESIIDDGLFIYQSESVTGRSAKEAPTTIGAIKTALFTDDDHHQEVVEKIQETNPESILVIGTSEGMVEKIRTRLGLPEIGEMLHIEDISTPEERAIAQKQRNNQGKHVVPVPTAQLKRRFSGYFIAPVKMLKGWGPYRDNEGEKTVVRPTYSYLGDYIISDRVISDIVARIASETPGVNRLVNVLAEKKAGELRVMIIAVFNTREVVLETAKRLQERCAYRIEEMTAFSIERIDIQVKGIEF